LLVIEQGFYAFRHALLQEAVYADLLPGERTRMHAAYAARIQSIPQGRGADARLAHHSLESKDFVTAQPPCCEPWTKPRSWVRPVRR
jgi:hypothetical protein